MALLLLLLMILIPFIIGRGTICIWYRSKDGDRPGRTDMLLVGVLVGIILAEAAHMVAVLLNRSLSRSAVFFKVGIAVCVLIATAVLYIHKRKKGSRLGRSSLGRAYTRVEQVAFLFFGVLVILQLIGIVAGDNLYLDGDMTAETVNSFLATDAVYQVNPLTGQAYELGVPLRVKIIGLPTLYAFLCQSFGLSPQQVIWHLVPAVVMLCSYMAYLALAYALFPKDLIKRGLFLIFVAVLISAGDYLYGMEGFGLLHSGFRGVSIRAAVLIPYTVAAMLRRRWGAAVLCIVVEACITWTFYGMGACLIVALGMTTVQLLLRKYYGGMKREEADSACRNS